MLSDYSPMLVTFLSNVTSVRVLALQVEGDVYSTSFKKEVVHNSRDV